MRRACGTLVLLLVVGISGCAATPVARPTPKDYRDYRRMFQDWSRSYVECVRQAGGVADVDGQSILIDPRVPGRDVEQGLDAQCLTKVGPAPAHAPVTKAYINGMYTLFLKQRECLIAQKVTMPPPPSREEFVANFGPVHWMPLRDAEAHGVLAKEARRMCPHPTAEEIENEGEQHP